MDGEVWRALPAPLNRYRVSNLGRVKGQRSIKTQHGLSFSTDLRLHVDLGGPEHRNRGVDDIVLLAFNNDVNQREDQPFIIHHDGDETNNRLNNLQRANYEQYHQADDRLRGLLGLPRRRILRSRRMELQYNPMIFSPDRDYVPKMFVYEDGEVSNTYADGWLLPQSVNIAGTRTVEIRQHNLTLLYPVAELVVDSWIGFNPDQEEVIYVDGNLGNLTLGNIQPANREELITHISNSIRISPDEEFRPIANINNIDYSHYLVSNQGRVYALNTRAIICSYDGKHGFENVQLYNGIFQEYSVHHLVWCTFGGQPIEEGFVVEHFDADRTSNSFENLGLLTVQQSRQLAIQERRQWTQNLLDERRHGITSRYQQRREGERWLPLQNFMGDLRYPLPEELFEVSNTGRVRNAATRRILRLFRTDNGYFTVSINERRFMVQRLVASTFVPNPNPREKFLVIHKDGDRTNNYSWNLQWVTIEEYLKYDTTMRVLAYNQETQESTIAPLTGDLFNFQNQVIPKSVIYQHCRDGTRLGNWSFVRMIEPAVELSEETQLRREQRRYGAVVIQRRQEAFVQLNQQQRQDTLENQEGIDIVTGRVTGNVE